MNQLMLPLIPEGANKINNRVYVSNKDDEYTYFLCMMPVYKHHKNDTASFRVIVCQLIEHGHCKPCEIIRTFGISKSNLDRALRKYRTEGNIAFFGTKPRKRKGTVITEDIIEKAPILLAQGKSRREVAEELEVPYTALAKALNDGRIKIPELPVVSKEQSVKGKTKSERSIEDAQAADKMGTACLRIDERVMASLGRLDGAETCFDTPCETVSNGGVLCALPALACNGLFKGTDQLGPVSGFYNMLHVLILLAFMALSRIKSIEGLSKKPPGEWGKLLGLDRAPEVHCLRKKMDQLSANDAVGIWSSELSRFWLSEDPDVLGRLYVDGHVRVYHGKNNKLPRKFVSREKLCMRGTMDYWVNDALGRPYFVIDKVINEGLLQTLRNDIVPRLLKEVPNQPSEKQLDADPHLCRFILVFDREGYSPDFMKEMWKKHRIACVTYNKYPGEDWPEAEFSDVIATMPNGERVSMKLAERGTLIGSGQSSIWVREIRKLTSSGHQTSLIGTAYQLGMVDFSASLFARWCQENFFRYCMIHYAIDLQSEYGKENLGDAEMVSNPKWRKLSNKINSLNSKLVRKRSKLNVMMDKKPENSEGKKNENWLQKYAELLEEIQHYEHELAELKSQRKETPKKILWKYLDESDKFQRPIIARKRLFDMIRMIAYRAETAMCMFLTKAANIDSSLARRILQNLFTSDANLIPDKDNNCLKVQIHRASQPREDERLRQLLLHLNAAEFIYPGTNIKMVFELVGDDAIRD